MSNEYPARPGAHVINIKGRKATREIVGTGIKVNITGKIEGSGTQVEKKPTKTAGKSGLQIVNKKT